MAVSTGPVETKVTAATIGAAVAALILWVLSEYVFKDGTVPEVVEAFVDVIVVAGVTFVSGYWAKHTARTDTDAQKR